MIKEIVSLKRENHSAQKLVVPVSRCAEFAEAVRSAQREFNETSTDIAVETFMGLSVRIGLGDRLYVQ